MTSILQSAIRDKSVKPAGVTLGSILQLRRKHIAVISIALFVDALLLTGALVAANLIYFGGEVPAVNSAFYRDFFPFYLVSKMGLLFFFKLYNDSAFERRSVTTLTLVEATIVATFLELLLVPAIILYLDPDTYKFSRLALLLKGGLEIGLLAAWHFALVSFVKSRGYFRRRTLMAGMSREGRDVAQIPRNDPFREIVGYVADEPDKELEFSDVPYLGKPDHVSALLDRHQVNELILTGGQEFKKTVLTEMNRHSISIKVLPEDLEIIGGRLSTTEVNDVPLVEINKSNLSLSTMAAKRLIDLGFAVTGLLIASPLFLVIWIVYLLFYGGEMIYRQPRIGRDGRVFTLYKIRTMIKDAERLTGAVICRGKDPRVLPIGWLLRRVHLDELPQLWNVLKGDMSLVGPRPERPERVEKFSESNPTYTLRHLVRPGLTGLAQVKGKYDTHFQYKLFYDLVYAFNVSIFHDLKILYMTPKYVFSELFGDRDRY